jgi:DNA-binding IclR family transcriptional regulator
MQNKNKYIVPAVDQASQILFYLAGSNSSSASLNEICARVGLHKSKAYSILETLQKYGLIQRNSEGKGYSLGPGLITLSRKVLDNFNISQLAEPLIKKLAEKAGGTATLGMIVKDKVIVVSKFEGGAAVGVTIRVGHQFPLTYGSHGKAIAANLPKKELDDLLKKPKLFFHGKPESFNRERFKKEIKQCIIDGFAVDFGEMRSELNSAAAAVLGPGGSPIGYIAVIGLFSAEIISKVGPMVADAGKTLSQKLGAKVASADRDI